jgi:hypothetical protein
MDAMNPHEHVAQARLEQLNAQVDALAATDEQSDMAPRGAHEFQAQLAALARDQEALRQTQAALDPTRLTTTVAQVRRWAEVGTHPNWIWAAYADVAQRLTRVEDRLAEMADSLRMMLGQQAALECQDHVPSKEPPMEDRPLLAPTLPGGLATVPGAMR